MESCAGPSEGNTSCMPAYLDQEVLLQALSLLLVSLAL